MPILDMTHEPGLQSWVESANRHADFPIQNLPHGVFSPPGGSPRGGVAIGSMILDIQAAGEAGYFRGYTEAAAAAASQPALNAFLALGPDAMRSLRERISVLLERSSPDRGILAGMLHDASTCAMHLPVTIGDYTDFYAGIHHATNVGKLFRPDAPLLPNYKYVPIGYHGRASSVRPSGMPVRRPSGQTRPESPGEAPRFGPCRHLDYELELGIWVGQGNLIGQPVPIGVAARHIAGYCLLNDWSARDIQAWEYQPLGPFLAKSFATTVSPWIVTAEALAPFRSPQSPRAEGDPAPLPYLHDVTDQAEGALGLTLEVSLVPAGRRDIMPLSKVTAGELYWTPAQLLAHHSSNGCDLHPGDLLGSGTISGRERESWGSLLELTRQGAEPLRLQGGGTRRFLEDGDEIIFRAVAHREGFRTIGFGECRAKIQA